MRSLDADALLARAGRPVPANPDVALGSSSVPIFVPISVPVSAPARRCRTCHGSTARGFAVCSGCHEIEGQLGRSLAPVLPVALAGRGSSLARLLADYKAGRSPSARREASDQIFAMLVSFLEDHGEDLDAVAGGPSCFVTVPSSGPGRASWHGRHPLCALVEAAARKLGRPYLEQALVRGPGALGHRRASALGYRLARPVPLDRVVVFDDTYASGARAQSAAAALGMHGITVVAIVPIVRIVRIVGNEVSRPIAPRSIGGRLEHVDPPR